jgi:hypothetical protein
MNLTAEAIETEFKQNLSKLMGKYGKYSVPKEEAAFISEVARAKHACLAAGSSTLDPAIMRQYSIMGRVIEHLCGKVPEIERNLKYSDRRRMMENWCAENIDSIITPNDLAEIGGVSYATAMKFINERVDLFRKVERGKYIVRNLRDEKK